MLLLKDGNKRNKKMFFIHDGAGELIGYMNILKNLETSFMAYGIEYNFNQEECSTIESISIKYSREILAYLVNEDVILLGWSLGGVIAFEIASILSNKGIKVDLILIDSFLSEKNNLITNKIMYFLGIKKMRNYEEILKLLNNINKKYYSYKLNDISTNEDEVQMAIEMIETKYQFNFPSYEKFKVNELYKRICIISFLSKMHFYYEPKCRFNNRTLFFAANNNPYNCTIGWKRYIGNNMIRYDMNATHNTIVNSQHSKFIASVLDKVFDN